MCLALPAEITAVDGDEATALLDGVSVPVSLALLEDVKVGDFVVLHVGFALSKIDPEAASAQLALMEQGGNVSGEMTR